MNKSQAAGEIFVFDFLSHDQMHHAFNEGYIRIVRAAFPDSKIAFYAGTGQIKRLAEKVADLNNVELRSCATFQTPFGLSRHNPIAGFWAASRCRAVILEKISRGRPQLVSVLGVDANLYSVLGRKWPQASSAPLHMILHSHLGDTQLWRSRNPLIRRYDFISRLSRPLPPQVRLVVLELGIEPSIIEIAPQLSSSLATLEHPVLSTECIAHARPQRTGRLTVAFLGHARQAKGFPEFVGLADACRGLALDFQAIGLASSETADLNMGALSQRPSAAPLSRTDYLAALREADFVCLPLNNRAYDFTASGTVIDAIANLKPLLALRNRPLEEMCTRYGQIGFLGNSVEELVCFLERIAHNHCLADRRQWLGNLDRIRKARRPDVLARSYRALVIPSREDERLSMSQPRLRR